MASRYPYTCDRCSAGFFENSNKMIDSWRTCYPVKVTFAPFGATANDNREVAKYYCANCNYSLFIKDQYRKEG